MIAADFQIAADFHMMTDFERDVLQDIARFHVDRGNVVLFDKPSLSSYQGPNVISYSLAVKDYWEHMLNDRP